MCTRATRVYTIVNRGRFQIGEADHDVMSPNQYQVGMKDVKFLAFAGDDPQRPERPFP